MSNISPENRNLADIRNILAHLYPDDASIRRISTDSGIDLSRVPFNSSAINNWHAVLEEAKKNGKVDALLDTVECEYKDNQDLRTACDSYRQSRDRAEHTNLDSRYGPNNDQSITLIINGEISDFTEEKKHILLDVLAAILRVDRSTLRILNVQQGSIRVTVEVPKEALEHLKSLSEDEKDRLVNLDVQTITGEAIGSLNLQPRKPIKIRPRQIQLVWILLGFGFTTPILLFFLRPLRYVLAYRVNEAFVVLMIFFIGIVTKALIPLLSPETRKILFSLYTGIAASLLLFMAIAVFLQPPTIIAIPTASPTFTVAPEFTPTLTNTPTPFSTSTPTLMPTPTPDCQDAKVEFLELTFSTGETKQYPHINETNEISVTRDQIKDLEDLSGRAEVTNINGCKCEWKGRSGAESTLEPISTSMNSCDFRIPLPENVKIIELNLIIGGKQRSTFLTEIGDSGVKR